MQLWGCRKKDRRRLTKSRMPSTRKNAADQCKKSLSNHHAPYSKCVSGKLQLNGYDMLWQSCDFHNWNHPHCCKSMRSSTNRPQDPAPQDCEGVCYRHHCHCSFSRTFFDCHDHRDHNHKPAAHDYKVQNHHAEPCDRSRSCYSGSYSHDSKHSSCNHCLYFCDDDRDSDQDHVTLPNSCLTKERTQAKSPPVQVPVTTVAPKTTMVMETHHHSPVSEIPAPRKLEWVPFANYPTPLPSLEYNAGGCLDESLGYRDDNQDLKHFFALCRNDTDSCGSYCLKGKKFSCKRPQKIKVEENFLWRFRNDPKRFLSWAVLEILVDLQHEHDLLACAQCAVNAKRKTKEN